MILKFKKQTCVLPLSAHPPITAEIVKFSKKQKVIPLLLYLCLFSITTAADMVCNLEFEEPNGFYAYDTSSFHNDGFIMGATRVTDIIQGKALYFSTSTAILQLGTSNFHIHETNSFSLCLWIKIMSLPERYSLLIQRSTYSRPFDIRIENNGVLRFLVRFKEEDCALKSRTILEPGHWYFICATSTDGSQRLYINGMLENNDSLEGPLNSLTGNLYNTYLGSKPFTGGFELNGAIDQLKIYNHALGIPEMLAIYNGERPVTGTTPTPPEVVAQP